MLNFSVKNKVRLLVYLTSIFSILFFTYKAITMFRDNAKRVKSSPMLGRELPIKSDETYEVLNNFRVSNNLTFDQLSYLLSLLNVQGTASKYRYKGDMLVDNSLTIMTDRYSINDKNYVYPSKDSITIISNNKILFQKSLPEVCQLYFIYSSQNKIEYRSTIDSYGMYLSDSLNDKNSYPTMCPTPTLDNIHIKSPNSIAHSQTTKILENAKRLISVLNKIERDLNLNRIDLGKILSASNLSQQDVFYDNYYQNDKILINKSEVSFLDSKKLKKIDLSDNNKIYILASDSKGDFYLLSDANFINENAVTIVHRQNSTYIYNLENMGKIIIN